MSHEMLPVTSQADAARYRAEGLWKDETVYGQFLASAKKHAGKTAVICGKRTVTYGELLEQVDNLAGNFIKLGIAPGDIVALQMPNSIEHPLIHIALNRIGAYFMPLHEAFRQTELRHLIAKAGAVAVVMPADYRGVVYPDLYREIAADTPSLKHRITIGGVRDGTIAFEDLLEPTDVPRSEIDRRQSKPDDIGHIMLSSGTTALPKISVFTNNNLTALMDAFASTIELTENDVAAALAPMGTGATGYAFPVLPVILIGGTSVILEHWSDPAEAVDLIVANKCTFATAIPTQLNLMISAIEARPPGDFSSFRAFNNAGAPLAFEVGKKIEALMGCKIHVVYGATDGGIPSMVSVNDPPDKRIRTVGRIQPGRIVELRDANGVKVPKGYAGEICWKTPDKSYGYLNDMEAARAAFDERGFYRSGDLGQLDDDGYLSVVGRVKDMILRGGQNISPRLIEDLLIQHPAVLEIAVAAMPHPTLGEQACAFVVLQKGKKLSLEEAVAFLTEKKIAKYQLPERLELMDQLPQSAGAKIAKNKLTEYVTAKLKAEKGAA